MKQTFLILAVISVTISFIGAAGTAIAATNQATYPGGGGVTLGDSNTITVNPLAINIVKEARLLDGTILGASTTLPAGTTFYFVIYVDNTADIDLSDVRMVDAVAAGAGNFTVDNTSFEILNNAGPGIDMTAANFTAWGDPASWLGLTWDGQTEGQADDYLDWNLSAGNTVTIGLVNNTQLIVPVSGQADKVANPHRVAFRFQVTMNAP